MINAYPEVISLIERLHRNFLEMVKLEFDGLGIHDINNVQGMMLYNIGDAEMTVGELTLRGCYLRSNVSYYVKKIRYYVANTPRAHAAPAAQESVSTYGPNLSSKNGHQPVRFIS